MCKAPIQPGEEHAELLAIDILRFLASRPDELRRFLAVSGVDPTDLRTLAADKTFLCGMLDFLIEDEPLLLAFATDAGLSPNAIPAARRHLESGPRPLESGES